jgi:hypothetical protein
MLPETAGSVGPGRTLQWVRMTTLFFAILGMVWVVMGAGRMVLPPLEVVVPVLLAALLLIGVHFDVLWLTRVALLGLVVAGFVYLQGFGLMALLYVAVMLLMIASMRAADEPEPPGSIPP